jgi:hypothetical protein
MEIFGRGGKDLIPMLNKGSEGIGEFREEAHRLGIVLDAETIANAKKFRLESHLLEARLEGLRNTIGSAVLPWLIKFGDAMGRAVSAIVKFKQKHAEDILQGIKGAIIGLTGVTLTWMFMNAVAIGEAIAGFIATAAAAVASAAVTVAAWIVAAAPFLAVAAAIIVVLLWLEDLYQFLTGGESVIGDFVAAFKDGLASRGGLRGFIEDFFTWFGDFCVGRLSTVGGDAAAAFVEKLKAGLQSVKNFFTGGGGSAIAGATINAVTSPNGFSAGASSPAAAAMSSVAASPVAKFIAPNMGGVSININASPGMDAKEVAGQVHTALEDWHDKKMREALESP